MQGIQEEQAIGASPSLQIRARWPRRPTFAPELRRLSVQLEDECRLIAFDHLPASGLSLLLSRPEILLDLLAEEFVFPSSGKDREGDYLDVFCHPGVTDSEGDSAAYVLGLVSPLLAGLRCRSGKRYRFRGSVPREVRPAVERLAGNALIHRFSWSDEVVTAETLPTSALDAAEAVLAIELRQRDDVALAQLSRELGLALDGAEMRAVARHFHHLGRPPTDVELQSLAQTWSEHCSHKTFKATIEMIDEGRHEVVHGLLAEYIAAPTARLARPWVRSAFTDNAGVIAFDDEYNVAFKVETHNHPSALEPFGGAHTGIGGVIRDVLAVSAEPIANTDVLCFGPPDLDPSLVPEGIFHPATTCREVVRGIADYGNNMGIPTVGGAILFAAGYLSNPLVFCGTLGIAPRGAHPRSPETGDLVVVLGGRTGRDGLHGATMSSGRLDRAAVEGTVVQIGNPITEKTVRDVLPHLRDERLYHAINDCGAGGLCSAVGEMGEALGVEVELHRVPLKYPGLLPWEIWLSEAQERMVLAVPPDALPRVLQLCRAWDVEATPIGRFRADGRLLLRYGERVVADLDMTFLHGGRPPLRLQAHWSPPNVGAYEAGDAPHAVESLLRLLRHPSIASKEEVIRQYDHEVGGATVGKPLVGDAGPADAAVLQPLPHSWRGVVVSHGINPLYGALDPHAMATLAVDEALRNIVAAGGDPERTALLDNFCWGDVDDPAQLGGLVRAARGCRDAAMAYGTPFISGKDSLYNSSTENGSVTSIPGTLLISALSVIPDVRRTVSMDLKRPGNLLYILGLTADELGGSHYLSMNGESGGQVPRVRPGETVPLMQRLHRAIGGGLVASCHDLSEGGLAVAAAEMAIAGNLGLDLQLRCVPVVGVNEPLAEEAILFAESSGRFLVEVAPEDAPSLERMLGDSPLAVLGGVTAEPRLLVWNGERRVVDLPVEEMSAAWRGR